MNPLTTSCPDCGTITRRDFLKTTLGGVAAASASGLLIPELARAASPPKSETLVATLFKSLKEEQQRGICFPFDHALRSKVDNNWMIAEPLTKTLNREQQAMVREIFLGLHSPEYAEKVMQQVVHDAQGETFEESTSVALFGEPGTGKFEFVLTGRHCTRRCDGDSVEGAAFGGPIFYGHAAESATEKADHPGNLYWYQARRANEVFQMLDGKQRETALLGDSRPEKGNDTIKLAGTGPIAGLPVGALSKDQRELVRKVMADVLAPFRKEDADEAMKHIETAGFDRLHLSFYKNQDIGSDGVWDVWQIEGPSMVWYFRGKPHVHVWVNVRANA